MEKNNQPLVSVVIPCYNHEQFVQDCIQSVIDQTYENIELIIIDDGSKDNSIQKIQEKITVCEKRFVNFKFIYRKNKGLCATLNEAISLCSGKYLSLIASDDQMLPEKTSIQVEYMNSDSNIIAHMGGVYWIDEDSKIIKKISAKNKNYKFNEVFLLKHDLNVCTQMLRSDFIKSVGGYPTNFVIEDWYMWLKILESDKNKVMSVDKILCKYRKHKNNSINNGYFIYHGLLQIALQYDKNQFFFKSISQIRWRYIAAKIISNKSEGAIFFYGMFLNDIFSIFSKNFWRCIRNLVRK